MRHSRPTARALARPRPLGDATLLALLALAAFLAAGLMPSLAFAANPTSSSISEVICKVIFLFTSSVGIVMAAIAICILGLTAALGRISWPVALTTVVGISIIFGAGSILSLFHAGGASACTGVRPLAAPELENVLCKVFTVMQGTVGAALATIAVCMLGIGALLGKVQWPTALTVIIGLMVLFSATSVLKALYTQNNMLGGLNAGQWLSQNCGSPELDFGYFSQSMCAIAEYMTGKKGLLVAVLGAIGVNIFAFSAMFGRVSWGTALTVGVGIGILFGASSIVGLLTQRNIACSVYGSATTYLISVKPAPGASSMGCVDPMSGDPLPCSALP